VGEVDQYLITYPLEFERLDNGTSWNIGDGADATKLPGMRHAAALRDSVIAISYPDQSASRVVQKVDNLFSNTDSVLFGLSYDGASPPQTIYMTTWQNEQEVVAWASYSAWKAGDGNWQSAQNGEYWKPLTSAGSRDEVAAGDGTLYWFDAADQRVWIRAVGGLLEPVAAEKYSDHDLYRPVAYVVDSAAN
jgi:hypothetical protein